MAFDTSFERSHAPNTTVSHETEVKREEVVSAALLIAHLEAGGLIARGDPRHIEFLRFEIYGENRVKHLGSYGWGSALGRIEDRLMDVLKDPHEWVRIPIDTARDDYENVAAQLLSETGEYENYDWRLTLWDNRPINTRTPQPDLLATVRKEVNRAALLQAARDVCPYCGSRAVAFFPAVDGPNEAGNFTHQHRTDRDARALCIASAIYSRLEASATGKGEMNG